MLDRAREWWGRLGRTNQLTLVLTTVGVLIALIGFVTWASTPDYKPLFSNLTAQDANAIEEKLREANIPHKLAPGGTVIEVPDQYVDEWHMKLVAAGLPQSATATAGLDDILNGQHIGDTREMEALRMRSALEGRISKSLMMMESISNAVVQFAASEDSPLLINNHEASASIFVTTKPGRSLSDENVRAIVRLTQMSYPGLQEKNISVTTSQGMVLWDMSHMGGAGGADIDKARSKFESDKRTVLQTALNTVFGPGNSIVTVSAEYSSDTKKETKIEPLQGVITSKTSSETKLDGAGSVNSNAAPGASANVGGIPTPPAAGGAPTTPIYNAKSEDAKGRFSEIQEQKTYTSGTDTTLTESGPGKLEKVSVSVLVDSLKYKDPAVLKDIKDKIKETISTSIMLAANEAPNGRMVSVVDMPFDHTQELQNQLAGEQQRRADMLKQLAGLMVPFLIMGVALFLLARALRRSNPAGFGQTPLLAGAGAGMGALPPGSSLLLDDDGVPMPGQMVGGSDMMDGEQDPLALSHGGNAPRSFEVIEETFDADLESILHLTRAKPEMVSMLMKSWLNED